MTGPEITRCPICGNPLSSQNGAEDCSFCLLQLGFQSLLTQSRGGPFQSTDSDFSTSDDGIPAHQRFGDYELLEEIARGGMGVVYRARQRKLNRLVAIKMILAGNLATMESLERFQLEAKAAARLHHEGIVRIYEIGEHQGQHYFTMELVDGVSLAEVLDDYTIDPRADAVTNRKQERTIARLFVKIAQALDFAHQHGVLHRDIKPSNILIDKLGNPHLTDFGLAKLTGHEESGLTLSNAVLGTPGYLSPEQAAGKLDVTTAADIYGLGATLYELLTGQPPFVGTSAVETMWRAIKDAPPAPRQLNPSLNRDLETIAMRCLEKEPHRRYSSAREVAEEFERFLRHEPIHARPIGNVEHIWRWCQRNPWIAFMSTALLMTILIGSVVACWEWWRAEQANARMAKTVDRLQRDAINDTLEGGQNARALAKAASLIRSNLADWKAASLAISIMEQRAFPVPAAPMISRDDELTVARLSPDGTRIAIGSADGTVTLWDAVTSKKLDFVIRHSAAVAWVEFSHDGRWLATCSKDKTVGLWDAQSGAPIWDAIERLEPVVRVHFSSDDQRLLIQTTNSVLIASTADGSIQFGPKRYPGRIIKVKLVADEEALFVATRDHRPSLFEVWSLEKDVQMFRMETGASIGADVSNDLTRAVVVDAEFATIWDLKSNTVLHRLRCDNGEFAGVKLSPDARSFAALGVNDWVRLWDTESGIPLTDELRHFYRIGGIEFQKSRERLLSWADDSLVQVWETSNGMSVAEPMRHTLRVQYAESGVSNGHEVYLAALSHTKARNVEAKTGAVQLWQIHERRGPKDLGQRLKLVNYDDGARVSPDGRMLATAGPNMPLYVIDIATGEPICSWKDLNFGVWGIEFTPDSRRLITTSAKGMVAILNIPEGTAAFPPHQFKTTFQPLEISRDGKLFVTGSMDGIIRIWSCTTGEPLHELHHGSEINSVALSSDNRFAASAGEDNVIRVWDVATGKQVHSLVGHTNEVMRVSFSPDNKKVLTCGLDHTVRIWDAQAGKSLFAMRHQGEVLDAVFSPDGRYAASASRDRTAMIWNVETGQPHVRSLLHQDALVTIRFSPDGTRLLTIGFHGFRLWDALNGDPLTVYLPVQVNSGIGFQSTSVGAQFTPDGQSVLLACSSPRIQLWNLPTLPTATPKWFPDLLEAVAGQRFASDADAPEVVPASRYLELKDQLMNSDESDFYSRWAKEWLKD